jgi:hypothetical protein
VGAGDGGPYPALRSGSILVLASVRWPRTQLRAVATPLTDPASFALLDGRDVAGYPDVAGWSAQHTARRAVAEHAAWLESPGELRDAGTSLAMLMSAARAALFLETVAEGDPELPLTVAATLGRLRDRSGRAAIDDAQEAFHRLRLEDRPPPAATVAALRELVVRLPSYHRSAPAPRAGLRSGGAGSRGS